MSWPSSESLKGPAPKLADPRPRTNSPQLRAPSDFSSPRTGTEITNLAREEPAEPSRISAYARLDFDHYTFFVQTLQVVLGRKSSQEFLSSSHHSVDVHLSSKKAISRRHAKIFYNFGTQRFEISVLGRNGAFVDDNFVAKGMTVPLLDSTKIQIGDIPFTFVLPSIEATDSEDARGTPSKFFNPTDVLNLRSNLYSGQTPKKGRKAVLIAEPKKEQRRNSKAEIVRRLSMAKRKSLASSSNDEINALLKELETFGGDAEDSEFDPALLDDDVKRLLHSSENLSHAELQKEEDEIDELVKQHNLGEGVVIEDTEKLESGKLDSDPTLPKDLAMDISMLDQEVASLAPLIDAHSDEKQGLPGALGGAKIGISRTNSLHFDPVDPHGSPLSGKLTAGPRMGKPATIQPPANRTYGRAGPNTTMGPTGEMDAMGQISQMGAVGSNFTSHMGTSSPSMGHVHSSGYHVTSGYPAYGYPIMRPPPPKLEVEVETITSVPVKKRETTFRAITVNPGHKPSIFMVKTRVEPNTPRSPLRRKDPSLRRPAKTQIPKEVPDQYKSKPTVTISAMISAVLRNTTPEKKGYTLSEILERIREFFPYYNYCPDGWQFPVTHNVKYNKMFTAVSKPQLKSEWLWTIDHAYIEERERIRKEQQEAAMAKAKEAALRTADYRSRPTMSYGHLGRPYVSSETPGNTRFTVPGSPGSTLGPNMAGVSGLQRPKSIAEIASEIKRDGPHVFNKTPLYFQRKPEPRADSASFEADRFQSTIKDQLAANRAKATPSLGTPSPVPQLGKPPSTTSALKSRPPNANAVAQGMSVPSTAPNTGAANTPMTGTPVSGSPAPKAQTAKASPAMNGDTKKSLTYLQKELFTLYKARNLTYNTTVTTEIITKALATTIAQVNIIGAKAGCGDNALSFLVEKAPQQVSKILDIALTKSIKEKQGVLSGQGSRPQTPQPSQSPRRAGQKLAGVNNASGGAQKTGNGENIQSAQSTGAPGGSPTYGSPATSATRAPFAGLSKPQSFTKPGALGKPPQYVPGKPRGEKRPSDEGDSEGKKAKAEE